jgi:hypothetical protein
LGKLHREWAVTGRIFQALPIQTDTTVALIYKILQKTLTNCPTIIIGDFNVDM